MVPFIRSLLTLNFITVHCISYVDSLFLVVSAITEAGLNTVDLSRMTTWQQVLLWLLIIIGSSIWVSIWTVLIRKHAFEQHFQKIVEEQRQIDALAPAPKPHVSMACGSSEIFRSPGLPNVDVQNHHVISDRVTFADGPIRRRASSSMQRGPGIFYRQPLVAKPLASVPATLTTTNENPDHGLCKAGRNGQFHGLTNKDRENLGGTEYRALRLLSVVVPVYFVTWQFFGSLALGAWIANNQPQPALDNAISPWWNGIFNGVSAFNNSGMSVLDLNMIPYGSSYFVLITMGVMILAGNTAYPIFLRLCIWCSLNILNVSCPDDYIEWKNTLEYILKYPRRVYTHMFPSQQTWWLVFVLVVLNGIDWIAFEVLNLGNPSLARIPTGSRVLDGLFQALAVRSGGFYVVAIPDLYIGLQLLYVIMMYISVYPVVITMRHSNVYEERSLGIYDSDYSYDDSPTSNPHSHGHADENDWFPGRLLQRVSSGWHGVRAVLNSQGTERHDSIQRRINFISHHFRGQLSHDLWWLALAVLFIMIIETHHFLEDPVTFSVFNVVFEVVSAYGCVGISIGLPKASYSFSGGLYPGSKLILCAVMLRGRHRGLPVALDPAVRLPDDEMHRIEEEDYEISRNMSTRRHSLSY